MIPNTARQRHPADTVSARRSPQTLDGEANNCHSARARFSEYEKIVLQNGHLARHYYCGHLSARRTHLIACRFSHCFLPAGLTRVRWDSGRGARTALHFLYGCNVHAWSKRLPLIGRSAIRLIFRAFANRRSWLAAEHHGEGRGRQASPMLGPGVVEEAFACRHVLC